MRRVCGECRQCSQQSCVRDSALQLKCESRSSPRSSQAARMGVAGVRMHAYVSGWPQYQCHHASRQAISHEIVHSCRAQIKPAEVRQCTDLSPFDLPLVCQHCYHLDSDPRRQTCSYITPSYPVRPFDLAPCAAISAYKVEALPLLLSAVLCYPRTKKRCRTLRTQAGKVCTAVSDSTPQVVY